MIEAESMRRAPTIEERPRTVDDVAELLRDRLAAEGARLSYRQNCESMQRLHIAPALGKRRIDAVSRQDVERLAQSMLRRGLALDHTCRARGRSLAKAMHPAGGCVPVLTSGLAGLGQRRP